LQRFAQAEGALGGIGCNRDGGRQAARNIVGKTRAGQDAGFHARKFLTHHP